MNQTLMAEIDTFTEQNDLLDLYEKYESELDAEIRQDELTLARYFMYRENGQSPRFAAIAACQRAPGTKGSDRAFNEHARRRMDRMHATNQERILGIAKRAGINTQGKYYVGGLGRYNDPAAWVSTTDDILSVAKARNLNVEGSVNHTATPVGPPRYGLRRISSKIKWRTTSRILASERRRKRLAGLRHFAIRSSRSMEHRKNHERWCTDIR